jgi:hypothetical protein
MNGESGKVAFPATLEEWKYVKIESPVWGIRHYRQEFAKQDPSSPLGTENAANNPDPDAIGFVFWIDSQVTKSAEARYLTHAKEAVKIVTEGGWLYPSQGLTPIIQKINSDVVKISMPLHKEKLGHSMFLFVLLGYIGHGVYI